LKVNLLFKDDEIQTTAGTTAQQRTHEKYFASFQSNFKLSNPKHQLVGFSSHLNDKSIERNYDSQTTVSAGYGLEVLKDDTKQLNINLGPGYRWSTAPSGTQIDEAILRAASDFKWALSESAQFVQNINIEAGGENTNTRVDNALLTSISDKLQLKAGLVFNHNTEVEANKENLDTQTTFTAVDQFEILKAQLVHAS
jgi:putative salt-induced outer membrane protein YdiY